jgi:hypothetical protein
METRSREGVLLWSLVDRHGAVRREGAGFGCLVEALRNLTATDARFSAAGRLTMDWSRAGRTAPRRLDRLRRVLSPSGAA